MELLALVLLSGVGYTRPERLKAPVRGRDRVGSGNDENDNHLYTGSVGCDIDGVVCGKEDGT
ncbi:hypothetical protein QYM36_016358, partial [Artemia franciscana]